LVEMPFGFAERVRPHDADDVEAVRARDVDDGGLEARRVGQKSRSA
jgi:hypothetical protein